MNDSIGVRPLVFVAMPFGTKPDPSASLDIDFDDIYERAIRPAVVDLDVEMIRADEERTGGLIHLPMYERLLLAEVVIADLTLANPNVFYELGIRHAARPKTTIMTFADVAKLPFDVAPLRALPYKLDAGRLADAEIARLVPKLTALVEEALRADTADSPLFQLIASYPGVTLPHEATDTFRDRTTRLAALHARLADLGRRPDRGSALADAQALEAELGDRNPAVVEVLIDLVLTYRDLEAYDDMLRCISRLPPAAQGHATIREQRAFALNRRNRGDDRQEAEKILRSVIHDHGPSPETYGLLGRVFKDRAADAEIVGDTVAAEAHLDEAITAYRAGFEADPRDAYPGVNAVTLLVRRGTDYALAEASDLARLVGFAVARRGGVSSSDYWDVATALELAAVAKDEATAQRAAVRATTLEARRWMYTTTLDNLRRIRMAYGTDVSWLDAVIERLEAAQTKAAPELH